MHNKVQLSQQNSIYLVSQNDYADIKNVYQTVYVYPINKTLCEANGQRFCCCKGISTLPCNWASHFAKIAILYYELRGEGGKKINANNS